MQSCHACIEAAKEFGLQEHPSVILLGAKNLNKIERAIKYLGTNGIKHVVFREPDIGDEITAVATSPVNGDKREVFRKYQLLREASK